MRRSIFAAHPLALSVGFAVALTGWTVALAPPQRDAFDHAQRIAAAPTEPARPSAATTESTPAFVPVRGADIVLEDYPLRTATLRAWHTDDRVVVPDPDGGRIELHVDRDVTTAGRRHLTLTHDALVSTFTVAGSHYFGTLATVDGVYALDGDDISARLTRQAALDQRINPHALDYRPRPLP